MARTLPDEMHGLKAHSIHLDRRRVKPVPKILTTAPAGSMPLPGLISSTDTLPPTVSEEGFAVTPYL